ncbi:hypothetical protein U27_00450 [Candidatus Vecturithrix granuli]|uniref:Uncharacterized protein n=1 Tax=Vecturithrix granuli TaxID=1499967 RepID=A0A081C7J8_VECG1|nr:hypothetical protein U27_00450 [Candidatus Vecturithrix granuli]
MLLSSIFNIKIKSHRIVLNAIRQHKEISGAQLSRITQYQPSTLVYILRTLEKRGLIEVSRIGKSTSAGGKPPTLWRLVADKGYIIGLEIIPHKIRTTVVDFSSAIIYQHIDTLEKNINAEEDSFILAEFLQNTITKLNLPNSAIIGVGMTFSGIVDRKKRIICYSEDLGIKNLAFCDTLESQLGIPVRIANDANAGALGIKWYQNPKQEFPSTIVFISFNEMYTGMGAGLILHNELYEGTSGSAGEILPYQPKIDGLLEEGLKKYGENNLKLDIRTKKKIPMMEIVESAKNGCQISGFLLENISQIIAEMITTIIGLINPDSIVIGGDLNIGQFIVNGYIRPKVEKECDQFFQTGVTIPPMIVSEFGIYSVSIGATTLILEEIFS